MINLPLTKRFKGLLTTLLAVVALAPLILLLTFQREINIAERFYGEGRYASALAAYRRFPLCFGERAFIDFNMGAALYRMKEYRKAAERFSASLALGKGKIKASSHYNLGNTLFQLAQEREKADPSAAASFYRQAAENYSSTMALDKGDKDARFNHALTTDRLRTLLAAAGKPGASKEERAERGRENSRRRDDLSRRGAEMGNKRKRGRPPGDIGDNAREKPIAEKKMDAGMKGRRDRRMTKEEAEALLSEEMRREGSRPLLQDKGGAAPHGDVERDW